MTPQDSQGGKTSEPQKNQSQKVKYDIIIEHNHPLMEKNEPLVEPDENENPFEALEDMNDKDDVEDTIP